MPAHGKCYLTFLLEELNVPISDNTQTKFPCLKQANFKLTSAMSTGNPLLTIALWQLEGEDNCTTFIALSN